MLQGVKNFKKCNMTPPTVKHKRYQHCLKLKKTTMLFSDGKQLDCECQGHFHNYLHYTGKKFYLLFLYSSIFTYFFALCKA